jgi:hypothetical protein
MANGVIKNAQTIAFRGSTLSLGDSLVGTVAIDCSIADVHYGTLSGDVILDFQKWAPAGTRGTVEVIFTVTAGQKIEITDAVKYGVDTIKGYTVPSAGNPYIIVPAGVDRVHYVFSSLDCGTTIEINQVDDSRIATRVKTGVPLGNRSTIQATVTNNSSTVVFPSAVTFRAGTFLYTSTGRYIGEVASDATATTTVTLVSPTTVSSGDYYYNSSSTVGRVGDQYGDILTNGDYIYVCKRDYDGTSTIWGVTGSSGSSGTGSGLPSYGDTDVAAFLSTNTGNIRANVANVTTANISNLVFDTGKVTLSANVGTSGYALTSTGAGGVTWASVVTPSALTTALASKVDTTTYNNAIALKADTSAMTTALAGKVDTTTYTTGLSLKADTSAMTTALAGKVDTTTYTTGLAGKVNTTSIGNIAVLNLNNDTTQFLNGAGAWTAVNLTLNAGANVTANNITANTITFTGTGPVAFTSQSTVVLTPATGANVVADGNLRVVGNSIFSTPGTVTNGTTVGVLGQIVVDTTNNKIWVCYGGTNWKSATLV